MSLGSEFEKMNAAVEARMDRDAVALKRDGFLIMPLGDDGESAIALGWVSRRAFARQLRSMDWEYVTAADVTHGWATETTNDEGIVYHFEPFEVPHSYKATWAWS